jgi:hypothetical protein
MLRNWSEYCESNPFSIHTFITPDYELTAYKWATDIDHNDIYHSYENFYVVSSSNNKIAPSTWLNTYLAR